MGEEAASSGEFEIERIPTCVIEARSKDLVPIFDYFQTPKLQQARFDDKLIEWFSSIFFDFVLNIVLINISYFVC